MVLPNSDLQKYKEKKKPKKILQEKNKNQVWKTKRTIKIGILQNKKNHHLWKIIREKKLCKKEN